MIMTAGWRNQASDSSHGPFLLGGTVESRPVMMRVGRRQTQARMIFRQRAPSEGRRPKMARRCNTCQHVKRAEIERFLALIVGQCALGTALVNGPVSARSTGNGICCRRSSAVVALRSYNRRLIANRSPNMHPRLGERDALQPTGDDLRSCDWSFLALCYRRAGSC